MNQGRTFLQKCMKINHRKKTVNNLKHNLEIQETKHQMELLKKDLEIEQINQRKYIEFDEKNVISCRKIMNC